MIRSIWRATRLRATVQHRLRTTVLSMMTAAAVALTTGCSVPGAVKCVENMGSSVGSELGDGNLFGSAMSLVALPMCPVFGGILEPMADGLGEDGMAALAAGLDKMNADLARQREMMASYR